MNTVEKLRPLRGIIPPLATPLASIDTLDLPGPERIFGSLPTDDLSAITIPGLAADLAAVRAAWRDGSLERTPSWIRRMTARVLGISAAALLLGILIARRRRRPR